MERQGGEIVAIPLPLYSHINSLLNICKFLASQGFSVTFLNAQSFHERISASCAGESNNIRFVAIPEQHAEAGPIAGINIQSGAGMARFRQACEAMAARHLAGVISSRGNVRCILADFSASEWARPCATSLGIPCAVVFLMSAACLAIHCCIPKLLSEKHIPVPQLPAGSMGDTISYLPGFPSINMGDIPFMLGSNMEKTDPGFECRIKRVQGIRGASCVMVNSIDALESSIFQALVASSDLNTNIVPIGPIIDHSSSSRGSKEEDECIKWLNKQAKRSVVYVAFGSSVSLPLERFKQIAIGLGESRCPFLWVLRKSLVPSCSINELLEFVHDNATGDFHTVSWAPQMDVLANDAVGCFFTHSGWNSTLESIWEGVPMICLPISAEQNLNSKFVSDVWKIGTRLLHQVNHQQVKQAIENVMFSEDGDEMRSTVRQLKQAARKQAYQNIISNI